MNNQRHHNLLLRFTDLYTDQSVHFLLRFFICFLSKIWNIFASCLNCIKAFIMIFVTRKIILIFTKVFITFSFHWMQNLWAKSSATVSCENKNETSDRHSPHFVLPYRFRLHQHKNCSCILVPPQSNLKFLQLFCLIDFMIIL